MSACDLLLAVDRDDATPLHAQIERELRDAVRSGRLAPGAALPPTRALAARLGVSRGVVVASGWGGRSGARGRASAAARGWDYGVTEGHAASVAGARGTPPTGCVVAASTRSPSVGLGPVPPAPRNVSRKFRK